MLYSVYGTKGGHEVAWVDLDKATESLAYYAKKPQAMGNIEKF